MTKESIRVVNLMLGMSQQQSRDHTRTAEDCMSEVATFYRESFVTRSVE